MKNCTAVSILSIDLSILPILSIYIQINIYSHHDTTQLWSCSAYMYKYALKPFDPRVHWTGPASGG